MKILFTHRYFWPDTPFYAAMLYDVAKHFAGRGDEVEVFASQPSYGSTTKSPKIEHRDGFTIRRAWVFAEDKSKPFTRLINMLLYCFALFRRIISSRPDVVTAGSFPPVAAAFVASLSARLVGARFIYHIQDIHPEVSIFSGGLLGKAPFAGIMRWLDNGTLRRAAQIIVLSPDMAATLQARLPNRPLPIQTISNFQQPASTDDCTPPADLIKKTGTRRAIFAGNMGKFQNLELLCEGFTLCFARHPELELLLIGDGEMKPALEKRWADTKQIRFGPFLPYAQAESLIAGADFGLISLAPNIHHVSHPSKALSYFSVGLPALALIEPESAMAQTIEREGLGAVPAEPTPEAIAAAIDRMLEREDASATVLEYHRQNTQKSAVMAKWETLFNVLALPAKPVIVAGKATGE